MAAAKAKPIPMTKYSGTLAGEYRFRLKNMSRMKWASAGLGGHEISMES
jgi:hypothetical protein